MRHCAIRAVVSLFGVALTLTSRPIVAQDIIPTLSGWLAQTPVTIQGLPATSAKAVIVAFHDWQDTRSMRAHLAVEPVVAKFNQRRPWSVAYFRFDFPFDAKCNTKVTTRVHVGACEAAVMFRLAAKQGKAQAAQDWLFANRAILNPVNVAAFAKERLGIDDFAPMYDAGIKDVLNEPAVLSMQAELVRHALPSYYINGRRFSIAIDKTGWLSGPGLEAVLAHEIEK